MKRAATTHRRRSTVLTDPQPEFVAICSAGANMTPFLVVRSADGVEGTMEIEADTAAKAADHEILRIVFDKGTFPEESVVKAWLDDGGYEDYSIVAKDDSFEVGEIPEGRDVRELTIRGAVVSVAMKLEVEEAARSEATAAAVDGVQPVAKKSDAPVVSEERRKSFYQVSELAVLVSHVSWLVSDMAWDMVDETDEDAAGESTALSQVKAAGQSLLDALATLVGVEVAEMALSFKTAEEERLAVEAAKVEETAVVETEVTEVAKEETTEEVTSEEVAKEEAAVEEVVETEKTEAETVEVTEKAETEVEVEAAKTEPTATEDLLSVVKSLVDTVSGLTTTVSALQAASVAKSEQDEADRVTGDDRQSRKGADVDETITAATKASTASTEMSEHRMRSVLGIRRK